MILEENHLPVIIIALIISWQIAAYFIYTYFKYRDKDLGLNKILLAFGFFYLFGFTGVFIRILSTIYSENLMIKNLYIDITHIIIFVGTLLFQIIVSSKNFNKVLDTRITKLMILLNIIFSSFILIILRANLKSLVILIAVAIGFVYISYFNWRLINLTDGNIKKRLIYIMVGEVLALFSVLMGTEDMLIFVPSYYQDGYLMFFMQLLLIGFTIVILGIYEFPAFLEFNWRFNLLTLYIFNEANYELLFQFDFQSFLKGSINQSLKVEKSDIQKLVALGGFKGIEKIFAYITNSNSKKIEIIEHGDITILLDYIDVNSNSIIFILMIRSHMQSIQYFLKKITDKFENIYQNLLTNLISIQGDKKFYFLAFNKKISKMLEIQ